MKRFILLLMLCSVSMAVSPTITSFNTGQVSPLLEGRADFEKYASSCRTVENMLITVQGPVQRRPGTKFIATTFAAGQYGFGVYDDGVYGQ